MYETEIVKMGDGFVYNIWETQNMKREWPRFIGVKERKRYNSYADAAYYADIHIMELCGERNRYYRDLVQRLQK